MVNIPQGGMSLYTPGRGITARPGGGVPGAAPRSADAPGPAATAQQVVARQTPPALPKQAVRAAWSPARLLATLLRILTAPTTAGPQAGPWPRAESAPAPAAPAPGSLPPATPTFVAALLRVLGGAQTAPAHAPSSHAPAGTSAERPAEGVQPPAQPRALPDAPTAGTRVDLSALAATAGQTPAAAPSGVVAGSAAPGEHPSPRAELVPPGDGMRGRNGVDLPIVPAALVALALPALAAVLASIF